jgi:hypothetical protein
MLIRYIFGPKSGEEEHVSLDVARPLLAAALAEAVNPEDLKQRADRPRLPKPGQAAQPRRVWSITHVEGINKEDRLAICLENIWSNNQKIISYCFWSPDLVHNRTDWKGEPFCTCFGLRVPDEIMQDYKRAWKREMSWFPYTIGPKQRPHPSAKADMSVIAASASGDAAGAANNAERLRVLSRFSPDNKPE